MGTQEQAGMAGGGEMELEAFRRLYPLQYYERYLNENVRPDARPLGRARATSLTLGTVPTADGSAMAKIGNTTMLAGVKLEVMTPAAEFPDEGRIAVDFQMPPICSPTVRPGRPVDTSTVVSEQLSNALISSGVPDLKELLISHGKAAWMAYLDIYCLDADGSLFDCAFLSAVGAFANLRFPSVSVTEEGKVIPATGDAVHEEESNKHSKVEEQRKQLTLGKIPFSLTCMLYKKHLLADPTAEEEYILQTIITVVLDSTGRLVSFYKPGGSALASTSTVQDCIALSRHRVKELQKILDEALSEMESV
uniref:Ribosomal RNA-processing protein 43 n=1 Tax=Araucaria cunninghamii TaxID=56994 RepID=A0A0D6R385_ARACU